MNTPVKFLVVDDLEMELILSGRRNLITRLRLTRSRKTGKYNPTKSRKPDPEKNCLGKPGDIFLIRESFTVVGNRILYKADNPIEDIDWKPPVAMKGEYCRYLATVEDAWTTWIRDLEHNDVIGSGVQPLSIDISSNVPCRAWKDYTGNRPSVISPLESWKTLWEALGNRYHEDYVIDVARVRFQKKTT